MQHQASFDAIAAAADAVARLDESVQAGPDGLATVMMLCTACEIASPVERTADRVGAFAALLGWWYAAESREFVVLDAEVREGALALDGVVERLRTGRALTPALLREGHQENIDTLSAVLAEGHAGKWSAWRLLVALSSGECGGDASLAARVARATSLMSGGMGCDALIAIPSADSADAVLDQVATRARSARERVRTYLDTTRRATLACAEFGRGGITARRLVQLLSSAPATTVLGASTALDVAVPSIGAAVERLALAGLVQEITGRSRDRVFVYTPAVALAV